MKRTVSVLHLGTYIHEYTQELLLLGARMEGATFASTRRRNPFGLKILCSNIKNTSPPDDRIDVICITKGITCSKASVP